MNASFVRAVALVVRRIGGTRTSIWDQPFFCSLIGLLSMHYLLLPEMLSDFLF